MADAKMDRQAGRQTDRQTDGEIGAEGGGEGATSEMPTSEMSMHACWKLPVVVTGGRASTESQQGLSLRGISPAR
jgi:hypothetical protein